MFSGTASDYLNNGMFNVIICGEEISFSKVSGISSSIEYDTYVEGGGGMVFLPKPKTSASTLTFEKGLSVVDEEVAAMFSSGNALNDIVVQVMKNNMIVEQYYVDYGMVVSWELADLEGMTSGVMIKKFTIAHRGIVRI